MPKTKETPTSRPPTNTKTAENLQKFSQCAFDILQIVKTIIDHPGEYKELHQKYSTLLNSLEEIMQSSGDLKFKDNGYFLPEDFLYLPYREETDRKVLYKAETNLRNLVAKIENERAKLLGNKYLAKTGIKDPELIDLLNNIKGNKTTKSTTTVDAVVTCKDGQYYYLDQPMDFTGNDTLYQKIFNIIYENMDKNGYISYKEIISHFREKGITKDRLFDKNKLKIQGAVTKRSEGLNRWVRVVDKPLSILNRRIRLITTSRGKGLKMNNKKEFI